MSVFSRFSAFWKARMQGDYCHVSPLRRCNGQAHHRVREIGLGWEECELGIR